MTRRISFILLAAFLIIWGLAMAINLTFQGMNVILGCLAVIAGVLLLVDR